MTIGQRGEAGTEDLLVDGRGGRTVACLRVRVWCARLVVESRHKGWTRSEVTEQVAGALVNGIGQDVLVPAADEVAMEGVSHSVTIRKYESTAASSVGDGLQRASVVDKLVEQGHELDWVRGRTVAGIRLAVDRVCDVRLVVGRVQVDTVPARGEDDLGTHAVQARSGGQCRGLWATGACCVVQTDEADGLGSRRVGEGGIEVHGAAG